MKDLGDLGTIFSSCGSVGATATGDDGALTGFGSSPRSVMAGEVDMVGNDSEVRFDKIAKLKAAIGSGTYNVSSAQVADRLIQSMLSR